MEYSNLLKPPENGKKGQIIISTITNGKLKKIMSVGFLVK